MGADLAALFDHADRSVGCKLLQADRGGQAGGAAAPTITTSNSIASRGGNASAIAHLPVQRSQP